MALLALDGRFLISNFLPSVADRRFPAIGRRDLKALLVVASPPEDNEYGLAPFDAGATLTALQSALGEIEADVLQAPTLNGLIDGLAAGDYALLHIVAHGQYTARGETVLYLEDEGGGVAPVPATRLVERLARLPWLPHLAFLASCESAAPGAEGAGSLGGLAQRLVRELGFPAVIAMSEQVSITLAEALAQNFYHALRGHGQVDRALATAAAQLAQSGDSTVCALFGRLGARPLFSDSLDRALTGKEISFGLEALAALLPERAPILAGDFTQLAAGLRPLADTDIAALSPESAGQRRRALEALEEMALQVADLSFGALALGQTPPPYDARSPFRGLYAFRQEDQHFFFGREALVQTLLGRLERANFLAVLGKSGSGKSSLVLAGLLPRLTAVDEPPQVMVLTPGADPLARLAAARQDLQPGSRVTVVDQFEELFTLCRDESQRQAFVDQMLTICKSERLILTMRADFWGECARYEPLREAMTAHQELIAPMTTAQLRSSIEQQAAAVGLRFEADLSHTILDTVRDEPGAMPLLQHALRQLWQRRHGRWLLTAEYRDIGGVQQAIAETAESIYAGSTAVEQAQIRDIFLRLTRLDEADQAEGGRDTRQRVRFEELVPSGADQPAIRRLVSRLADERLVITGRDPVLGVEEVEVAHEALIQYWPRLQDWLNEDRDLLRLRAGVRQATREWLASENETGQRDGGYLFRGARLAAVEEYAADNAAGFNDAELEFLQASLAERQRLEREKEEQRRKEEQLAAEQASARRFRRVSILAGLLLVIAAVLAVFAFSQFMRASDAADEAQQAADNALESARAEAEAAEEADAQRALADGQRALAEAAAEEAQSASELAEAAAEEAEASEAEAALQRRRARAAELAAESALVLAAKPQLALLLAVEAMKVTAEADEPFVPAAEQSLRQALSRIGGQPFTGHPEPLTGVESDLSGRWLALVGQDRVSIWPRDGALDEPAHVLNDPASAITMVDLSDDGRYLAVAAAETVRLFDLSVPVDWADPTWRGEFDALVRFIALDAAGSTLAVLPEGNTIFVYSDDGTGQLQEALAAEVTRGARVGMMDLNPDGRWMIASRAYINPQLVDDLLLLDLASVDASGVVSSTYRLIGNQAVFSPDGRWLARPSSRLELSLHDLTKPDPAEDEIELSASGGGDRFIEMTFSPAGDMLVAATDTGTIAVWDLTPEGPSSEAAQLAHHQSAVSSLSFSPDGEWLVSSSEDGQAALWPMAARSSAAEPIALHGHDAMVTAAVTYGDGRSALTLAGDGAGARLWPQDPVTSRIADAADPLRFAGSQEVVLDPMNRWLAVGPQLGNYHLWDVSDGALDRTAEPHQVRALGDPGRTLAFSQDGRWLAALANDRPQVYELTTGVPVEVFTDNIISQLVGFTPDSRWLASGFTYRSGNLNTSLLDLTAPEPGQRSTTLGPWGEFGRGITFLAECDFFGDDLALYHLSPELEVNPVDTGSLEPHCPAAFSGDGRYMAALTRGGTSVYLWPLTDDGTLPEPTVLSVANGLADEVAFSSSGLLAAVSYLPEALASEIRIWDPDRLDGDEPAFLLESPVQLHRVLAFSNDGRWLGSFGVDQTLRFWDLEGDEPSSPALNLDAPIDAQFLESPKLEFSNDGRWLALNWGSIQRQATVWRWDPEAIFTLACQTAGRNLSQTEWREHFPGEAYRETCER